MKIRLFIALILLAFAGASCTHEQELAPVVEGVPVSLKLAPIDTRADEGDALDSKITQFRLIVFKPNGGGVAYNQFTTNLEATDANPVQLDMMTGVYDFVFIANEGTGTGPNDMHTVLAGYNGSKSLPDLYNEAFNTNHFQEPVNIPMTYLVRNVTVKPEGIVNLGSADVPNGAWNVALVRLAIRVDLQLTANAGLADHFMGVEFSNVPDRVYLFPTEYNSANPKYYENNGSVRYTFKRSEFTESSSAEGITWTKSRVILPASVFAQQERPNGASKAELVAIDAANSAKALTLNVMMDDRDPLTATIGVNEPQDFTAPRNHWFKFTGTIKDYLDFTVSVSKWDWGNNNYYFPLPNPLDDTRQANSFIVKPGSKPFSIPVRWADDPRILSALGGISARIGSSEKLVAELLWTDTKGETSGRGLAHDAALMDVDVHDRGSGAWIVISPGSVEGNAVIALRRYSADPLVSGEILWSWHLWVTDYDPDSFTGSPVAGKYIYPLDSYEAVVGKTYTVHRYADDEGSDYVTANGPVWGTGGRYQNAFIMDRSLGKLSVSVSSIPLIQGDRRGMLAYQFGRKDPFLGVGVAYYDAEGTPITLATQANAVPIADGVKNPTTYYQGITWTTDNLGTTYYWNDPAANTADVKSIFDPCPAGWRIPVDAGLWNDLRANKTVLWPQMANVFYAGYRPKEVMLNQINFPMTGTLSSTETQTTENILMWTSKAHPSASERAIDLTLSNGSVGSFTDGHFRYHGGAIRCIQDVPAPGTLKVSVSRGNLPPAEIFNFDAEGGDALVSIESHGADGTPLPWIAEYSTDGGANWTNNPAGLVSDFPAGETGDLSGTVFTLLPSPSILGEGSYFQNVTSRSPNMGNPWNLSNQTNGGATIENTANSYIVNDPGWYRIPLVYGNAIQNGAKVPHAYTAVQEAAVGSTTTTLKTFLRHDGEPIADAYITGDENGLVADHAALVWMDYPGLVSVDATIVGWGANAFLRFQVPQDIHQGNAIIAVRDKTDSVLWSWHIWVTPEEIIDMDASPEANSDLTANRNGSYNIMKYNLGWTQQRRYHAPREVMIRVRQTGKNAADPVVLTFTQAELDELLDGNAPYWQFGRKDPMPGGTGLTGGEKTTMVWGTGYAPAGTLNVTTAWSGTIPKGILNPHIFYTASGDWNTGTPTTENGGNMTKRDIQNLWSMENAVTTVNYNTVYKTVYDPSPYGFMMPASGAWTGFTINGTEQVSKNNLSTFNVSEKAFTDYTANKGYHFYLGGWRTGNTALYPSIALRLSGSGEIASGYTDWGYYWSAGPYGSTGKSYFLNIGKSSIYPSHNNNKASGLSVRPMVDTERGASVPVDTYKVSFGADYSHGMIRSGTNGGTALETGVPAGTSVTYTAMPDEDYLFLRWGTSGISLTEEQKYSQELTFVMPAGNVSIAPTFVPDEVTIHGVTWSQLNLDTDGIFTSSLTAKGGYFTYDVGYCPNGWRRPDGSEFGDLLNDHRTGTSFEGGIHTIHTDEGDLYLPAAGYWGNPTVAEGYYWSRTPSSLVEFVAGYVLQFSGGSPAIRNNGSPTEDRLSVRCVRL